MNTRRDNEIADRFAEERSEDEGMPEHPAKARDPVRWAAERSERVSHRAARRPPAHTSMFGIAFVSCVALVALASARRAVRWVLREGRAVKLPH
ncbi:hypothetical protein KPL78_15565 [Roseomonas sp. HJA6]|uniref:Uncharacterized protein n=1 Tax=Roseomonas alba TaxID=2846776 RepID=A0ABS7AAF0_9PROT|nr:hypothetical protein [Neoroseomonas alba]MBW6399279.1 hypothetical protein [Neoroseomonas alba]